MRHGKKFNHLSRKSAHRKAMLANMACSLIEHKRIKTTLAKAKALRVYIEPLITKSKNDTTHSRRVVFSYLKQKSAITELFGDIAVKVADRPGGYIRILKLNNRLGDNAQMAFVELVDYNEEYLTDKPKRKKARRTRRKKTNQEAEVIEANNQEDVNEKVTSTTDVSSAKDVATEEAPATEEIPTEEVPTTEDVATEEAPATEEVAPEEVSTTEEVAPEEVSTTEEVANEDAPATEEVSTTEEVANEDVPSTEDEKKGE